MIDRKLRQKVEQAFYCYALYKERIKLTRAEIIDTGLVSDFGRHTDKELVSVDNKVVALDERGVEAKWVSVVDRTLEKFKDTGKDTLIRLKYFSGAPEAKLCMKLYIERRETLYEWINCVLTFAAMLAIQEGLVKVA